MSKRLFVFDRGPDIEAKIYFLTTAEGGRSSPVFSGYRPDHDTGVEGTVNCAVHVYVGVECAAPGDTVQAQFWFAIMEYQIGRLYEGMEFTVQEGARIVGRGKVMKVLNDELRKSDAT